MRAAPANKLIHNIHHVIFVDLAFLLAKLSSELFEHPKRFTLIVPFHEEVTNDGH